MRIIRIYILYIDMGTLRRFTRTLYILLRLYDGVKAV